MLRLVARAVLLMCSVAVTNVSGAAASAEADNGDLLIFGGPIYTGTGDGIKVEALLLRAHRIAFVGP
jgi:hypothetical protein